MTRKIAERSSNSPYHVICPFCGFETTWLTEMAWCAGCYVEFTVRHDEEGLVVAFDDKKRSPKFALAKALAKAGGVRFGPEEFPK